VSFKITGTDAKGKQGKCKDSKGGKGGKGHYVSKEVNATLTKAHGKGADYYTARREWCNHSGPTGTGTRGTLTASTRRA
jgi:hypothetical protein